MSEEGIAVKVAVRVRPFNQREIDKGSKCIIQMKGKTTVITDPLDNSEKQFTYDYSYWSFDSSDPNYASQKIVFNDLGLDVIKNAWEGYNCCIFAYGQTGSGKSYSMLGYGDDKGIIPQLCEALFEKMNDMREENVLYKVEVSFMEIYNEKVKDLLNPANSGQLKVRNHPKIGPYVEDLSKIAVKGYSEIETLMDEGSKTRTVASTNMNATSSRSHAVFTIEFTQTKLDVANKQSTDRVSKINLVDLAGSERVMSTGATGVRLKEGANINKSLSSLGKVISALAMNSNSAAKKMIHVPYRDSVLTWLLKESLGGNAKTIMLAAISPADVNHGETLSTLRYADNAKQIKNKAIVNEDPTQKLIRDLKSEVEALRTQLVASGVSLDSIGSLGSGGAVVMRAEEVKTLKDELAQREKLITEMNKSWEEKLKEAQTIREERKAALQDVGVAIKAVSSMPHLINLNEDPLMSESLIYYLKEGTTLIGRSDAETPQDIVLKGLGIAKEHCVIENKEGNVTIIPCSGLPESNIFINGQQIAGPFKLTQGCRVILGNNHVYRFNNPEEAARAREKGGEANTKIIDWDFAVQELASTQGQLVFDQSKMLDQLRTALRTFSPPMTPPVGGTPRTRSIDGSADPSLRPNLALLEAADIPKEKRKFALKAVRRWREKVKKKKLQQKIEKLILLIKDANAISEALNKDVTFGIKMMGAFPGISEKQAASKMDVAVTVVNRQTKATTIWEYEKFIDQLEEMREWYQNFLESGMTDDIKVAKFDVASQEQMIGVAHMYLKNLLYLFEIRRTIPILDNSGEPAGELHVEILPILPPDFKRPDDGQADPKMLVGKKINIVIRVLKATNLPFKQYKTILCKFSFWEDQVYKWSFTPESAETTEYETSFAVDQVTEDFLNYLEMEAIAFELYGKHFQEVTTPSVSKNDSAPVSYDIFASVDVKEVDETGQAFSVPLREERRKDNDDIEPTNVFLIRKGMERQIVLTLVKTSDPVSIEKCTSASVGNIRLKSFNSKLIPASQSTSNLKALISAPQKEEFVPLKIIECSSNSVTLSWLPGDHNSNLLQEKTVKGYVVTMQIQFNLELTHFTRSVSLRLPLQFKVKGTDSEFKRDSLLLEQFKGLLKETSKEDSVRGTLFNVNVTRHDVEENKTVTAMIDEHQENIMKIKSALQMERLKQELELQERLSPLRPDGTNSNGTNSKPRAEFESKLSSLKQKTQAKRKRAMSRLKTVSVEVPMNSVHKKPTMSGFLNKKSASTNKWKKFWFGLRRPYLYFYTSENLENEKSIDLTNSAITLVNDEQIPFAFAIVTYKRLIMLQASSRDEMDAWMKHLDPTWNVKEAQTELKERMELINLELETRDLEIFELSTKLQDAQQLIDTQLREFEQFTGDIKKNTESIKSRLAREIGDSERKNKLINQLKKQTQDYERKIDEQNKQLDDLSSIVELEEEEREIKNKEILADLTKSRQEIESLKDQLTSKDSEMKSQAAMISQLQKQVSQYKEELHSKDSVIQLLEEANNESKKLQKQFISELEALKDSHHTEENRILMQHEEMKVLQQTIIERDYKNETINDKAKTLEDELKSLHLDNDQLRERVKLLEQELQAKDDLLSDKVAVKLPTQPEGFKLFGNSRAEVLEKELVKTKQAVMAHQTHGAFLGMELSRLEKEMKLQQKLREQTIDRLKKEVVLLRRRLFNLSKDKGESPQDIPVEEVKPASKELEEYEKLKKKYFFSIVVGVKMNLLNQGRTCNASGEQLFETAISEGVTNFEEWASWIDTRMTMISELVPM